MHIEVKYCLSVSVLHTDAAKDYDGNGKDFTLTDLSISALEIFMSSEFDSQKIKVLESTPGESTVRLNLEDSIDIVLASIKH